MDKLDKIFPVNTPSRIEKLKCFLKKLGDLLCFKPILTFDPTTEILTSTYINGKKAETRIPIGTSTYVEGTWEELNTLAVANKLIPGQTYILTDYQTEYYIPGSMTSKRAIKLYITSVVASYAVLENDFRFDLSVGETVEILELPTGYIGPLFVGQTTTVTETPSQYYFKFANAMQSVVGLRFKYALDRYQGILEDSTILDDYGNSVMTPLGVINTEVHNGQAYMAQSAAENMRVPTERIILLAVDTNSFRKEAESDTFEGDYLEFDFNDTTILNEDMDPIGTRKGYITRRATFNRKIDIEIDWRVIKSRRWLLNRASRSMFCNTHLPTTSKIGYLGEYIFQSFRRKDTQTEPFYLAQYPEGKMLTTDEKSTATYFDYSIESLNMAKDFNCFELDSDYNPVKVDTMSIKGVWSNTVFRALDSEFNFDLLINLDKGSFKNSTFNSYVRLKNVYQLDIDDTIFLDSLTTDSCIRVSITKCQFLSHVDLTRSNSSKIEGSIFGTVNVDFPGTLGNYSWNAIEDISNTLIIDSVIGARNARLVFSNSKIVFCSFFLGSVIIEPGEDAVYARETVSFINSNMSRVIFRTFKYIDRLVFNTFLTQDNNPITTSVFPNFYVYDCFDNLFFKDLKLNKFDNKIQTAEVNAAGVLTVTDVILPL